jgi:hypothetical protein
MSDLYAVFFASIIVLLLLLGIFILSYRKLKMIEDMLDRKV